MEETKQPVITISFNDGSEINWEYQKDYDNFKIGETGELIFSLNGLLIAIYAAGFWKSVIPHY
jgi:hypothetical protein